MSKVMLKSVKLSFPKVFEHGSFGGESTGKYEATFLLPKSDTATYKKVMSAIEEVKGKTKIPSDKLAIKDGDELDDDITAGYWVIKTANKNRPTLLDRQKNPVTKEDNEVDPMFFGGATVNASISFWKQDNNYGKRVNGNLAGIQYVSGDIETDGFSDTGTASADEFDEFDDEEM
jgi:hypothetical protein